MLPDLGGYFLNYNRVGGTSCENISNISCELANLQCWQCEISALLLKSNLLSSFDVLVNFKAQHSQRIQGIETELMNWCAILDLWPPITIILWVWTMRERTLALDTEWTLVDTGLRQYEVVTQVTWHYHDNILTFASNLWPGRDTGWQAVTHGDMQQCCGVIWQENAEHPASREIMTKYFYICIRMSQSITQHNNTGLTWVSTVTWQLRTDDTSSDFNFLC